MLDGLHKDFNIKLDLVSYEDYTDSKAPFIFSPSSISGLYKSKLIINKRFIWNESLEAFNDRLYNKNYIKGLITAKD